MYQVVKKSVNQTGTQIIIECSNLKIIVQSIRPPINETINNGLLQFVGTQKVMNFLRLEAPICEFVMLFHSKEF